jgi:glycosyltransferase involved in cell wall biosynthesis
MKILFLAPYPAYESPSQRYRFEHYLDYLQKAGIGYDYKPFLSNRGWEIFFSKGNVLRKIMAVCGGFVRRWLLMCRIARYEFVFIHREAAPLGPPVFEWIIAKLYRKKIIYDYDDAIWVPVASENNKMARYIKWFSKVKAICKMSYKVSAGNQYLADYARPYCRQVIVVPTVVDTDHAHNQLQRQDVEQPVIGWTGTFSTLKYLDILVPVIQGLQEKYDFSFLVIANKDPELPIRRYRFVNWNKDTEIKDLLQMHIGVMPLYDGEIEKGKCGFKAIQYMALGIPAVVSPVGVNAQIVENGVNGFVAASGSEWAVCLEKLLADPDLRRQMGIRSRLKIEQAFSVNATKELFINLFS